MEVVRVLLSIKGTGIVLPLELTVRGAWDLGCSVEANPNHFEVLVLPVEMRRKVQRRWQ